MTTLNYSTTLARLAWAERTYNGPIPKQVREWVYAADARPIAQHVAWRRHWVEARRNYMRSVEEGCPLYVRQEHLTWLRHCVERYVVTKRQAITMKLAAE